MTGPERIWAFDYDDCSSDNEDEWRLKVPIWTAKDPHPIEAPQYIRADLVPAIVRAALEAAAREIDCGGCYGQCPDPNNCQQQDAKDIRALAADPEAVKRIIGEAGNG